MYCLLNLLGYSFSKGHSAPTPSALPPAFLSSPRDSCDFPSLVPRSASPNCPPHSSKRYHPRQKASPISPLSLPGVPERIDLCHLAKHLPPFDVPPYSATDEA